MAVRLGKRHIIIVYDREDVNPYCGTSRIEFAAEYYQRLLSLPCTLTFRKVKAHTTGELRNPLNAIADALASSAVAGLGNRIAVMEKIF